MSHTSSEFPMKNDNYYDNNSKDHYTCYNTNDKSYTHIIISTAIPICNAIYRKYKITVVTVYTQLYTTINAYYHLNQ